jgi:photosystem II stability/assembly factor-like uncharacterized protein
MNLLLKSALCLAALAPAATAQPAWRGMLNDLPKKEKAGFGGLCGICVDRSNGHVLINVSDRGFYRSTDQADTFTRISDTQPRGRTETPGCFLLDPTGKSKTMLTALVYGAPVSVSTDGGATWSAMDRASAHVDWCAVDWPERKFVLVLKHEAGGLLLASRDGGKTFAEVGKGYGTGWVFSATTAVVAEAKTKDRPNPGLVRTTDAGKTWQTCVDFVPVGTQSAQALPRWYDGALYWLVADGLIVTRDEGKTWTKSGAIKGGRYGPVFGKDAKQMFVLTTAGIVETTDGGATWSAPAVLPGELKSGGLAWIDYDPRDDVLYAMKMGSDLYRWIRQK